MPRWTLAAVGACVLLAVPPARGQDTGYVKLVHADTGKVLTVADKSEDAGAKVLLAKDDGTEIQQWKIEKDGSHFKLVNRKSGKVLDVNEDSRDEEADIIQWDDKSEGYANQRWSWEGDGKTRRLKSKSSGLVLDIGDDGTIVQKKSNEKAKGQLWQAVEVKK